MPSVREAFRLLLGVLLLITACMVSADSMLVPARTQAEIFKKMLVYDHALSDRPVTFVLVGAERNPGAADELAAALRQVGLSVERSRPDELGAKAGGATVVYLLTAIAPSSVRRLCSERSVLSVSGFPGLAENGDVSVAVGLRTDGKPQIFINRAKLKAEGHEFSAELLRLAKLVG